MHQGNKIIANLLGNKDVGSSYVGSWNHTFVLQKIHYCAMMLQYIFKNRLIDATKDLVAGHFLRFKLKVTVTIGYANTYMTIYIRQRRYGGNAGDNDEHWYLFYFIIQRW